MRMLLKAVIDTCRRAAQATRQRRALAMSKQRKILEAVVGHRYVAVETLMT